MMLSMKKGMESFALFRNPWNAYLLKRAASLFLKIEAFLF
jgi:hypothetical protein